MPKMTAFSYNKYFPLLAAGSESDAERRAVVATQWRDRFGRWVDMGRSIKFKVRLRDGNLASVIGKFDGVDPTHPGMGRVRVSGDVNLPDGDYFVSSDNGQEVLATLNPAYLRSRGIVLGEHADGGLISERGDFDVPSVDGLIAESKLQGPVEVASTLGNLHEGDMVESAVDGNRGVVTSVSTDAGLVSLQVAWEPDGAVAPSVGPLDQPIKVFPSESPVSPEPSEFQVKALEWYTDFGFDAMDKFFRKGQPIDALHEEYLHSLVDLIEANPVKFDTKVYRGRAIMNPERAAQVMALQVGDVVEDTGIASTSPDYHVAERFANFQFSGDAQARVLFEIDVPAGAKMYSLKPGESSYSSETEALLAPNSRIRVTHVSDEGGLRVIRAELQSDAVVEADPPFVFGSGSFFANGLKISAGDKVSFSVLDDYQSSSHDAQVVQVDATFTGFDVSMFSANPKASGRQIVQVLGNSHVPDGFYVVNYDKINNVADLSDLNSVDTAGYFATASSVPSPNQLTPISDPDVARVVQNYTANHGSHMDINDFLRNNPNFDVSSASEGVAKDISTLDGLISSQGLLKDTSLFRGRSLSDVEFDSLLAGLDSGAISEFSDGGFSSTSTDLSVAQGFASFKGIVFNIQAPEGYPAFVVPSFLTSLSGAEQEVLLPRGVQMKVLSHEVIKTDELFSKTHLVVTVELVNGVEVTHFEEKPNGGQ
jgi:ADP-ribosyltransferase exoenzyme